MRPLLPVTTTIAATKKGLMESVYRMGLAAIDELLRGDAEKVAGTKGRRDLGRARNHRGSAPDELTSGGRRVQVARPACETAETARSRCRCRR